MFGWEFPPHIAGGLGTACYGMTRGLARNGVDVTFVVPHAYGDEDQRFLHIVNASDVDALYGSAASGEDDILSRMSFIHIDSNMVPYISPEEYDEYTRSTSRSARRCGSAPTPGSSATPSRASTAPTSWRTLPSHPVLRRRCTATTQVSST